MSGNIYDTMKSILGGGVPGSQPKNGLIGGGANSNSSSGMEGGQPRGMDRSVLRRAFNNQSIYKANGGQKHSALNLAGKGTLSFRAAMNAGDPLHRYQQSCGGSNQVNNVRRSGSGVAKSSVGGVSDSNCKKSTSFGGLVYVTGKDVNPLQSGNHRYVYDGSDYTRFKKLASQNRNYNDKSFGGSNNGAYSAFNRVRR